MPFSLLYPTQFLSIADLRALLIVLVDSSSEEAICFAELKKNLNHLPDEYKHRICSWNKFAAIIRPNEFMSHLEVKRRVHIS